MASSSQAKSPNQALSDALIIERAVAQAKAHQAQAHRARTMSPPGQQNVQGQQTQQQVIHQNTQPMIHQSVQQVVQQVIGNQQTTHQSLAQLPQTGIQGQQVLRTGNTMNTAVVSATQPMMAQQEVRRRIQHQNPVGIPPHGNHGHNQIGARFVAPNIGQHNQSAQMQRMPVSHKTHAMMYPGMGLEKQQVHHRMASPHQPQKPMGMQGLIQQVQQSGLPQSPFAQNNMGQDNDHDEQDTPDTTKPNTGDTLAGQTITVEAVECMNLQGPSRRLIKLVVSGAKGQAHNLLSKNAQLQTQILSMMQKAKTSTAEVSFPTDTDLPIKVTCKSDADTKPTPSNHGAHQPMYPHQQASGHPNLPNSNAGQAQQMASQQVRSPGQRNLPENTALQNALQRSPATNQHTVVQNRKGIANTVQGQASGVVMAHPVDHSPITNRLSNVRSNTQDFVRTILESEKNKAKGAGRPTAAIKDTSPVASQNYPSATQVTTGGVLSQSGMQLLQQQLLARASGAAVMLPQNLQHLHLQQQVLMEQKSPDQQQQQQQQQQPLQVQLVSTPGMQVPMANTSLGQNVASSAALASGDNFNLLTTKQSGSIKVMGSPGKDGSGDSPQKSNWIPGNDYTIQTPNGHRVVGTWDGKYFKVKNPIPRGDTPSHALPKHPAKKKAPPAISQPSTKVATAVLGNTATMKTIMGAQLSMTTAATAGSICEDGTTDQMDPNTSAAMSAAADTERAAPEMQAFVKKCTIPFEEGKYAVCENCGNLNKDYTLCEACKRPLPEQPRFYNPQLNSGNTQIILMTSGNQTITTTSIATAAGGIKPKQFFGSKEAFLQQKAGAIVQTVLANSKAGRGILAKKGIGKSPKGKGKGRQDAPEMVTILSSEDEGDEGPSAKQARLDPEVAAYYNKRGRKSRMEDESGKIVGRKTPVRPAGSSNVKSPEAKIGLSADGKNQVIRLVDPVIQLDCQSVRVGSLQALPLMKVEFSLKGFRMMLKIPSEHRGSNSITDVRVDPVEITEILASFKKFLVLFVKVVPNCALRIRAKCGMCVSNSDHYFGPDGKMDSHRYLTILMNNWDQRDQEIFKAVCQKLEADKSCAKQRVLVLLPPEKANEMLIQASYVGPPKKKQPGSDMVLPTTSLLTSQVVLTNQGGVLTQVLMPQSQSHVILTLAGAPQGKASKAPSMDGDEEEEPVDRSRSPSPLLPIFNAPIVKLFTYPPPPIIGGISVSNEDLFCLNEGEFLNDVIIDFYVKYLFNEILSDEDRDRTHIFSSFFYRRLTQKQVKRVGSDDTQNMTAAQKRHSRVKTWSRHVDLLEKDFIIVPINESAHWYLAIICFPGLREPVIMDRPMTPPDEGNDPSQSGNAQPQTLSGQQLTADDPAQLEKSEIPKKEENSGSENSNTKKKKSTKKSSKVVMQPCILVFDSLSGPGRTGVVRTLREYIQVEWDNKKAPSEGPRPFTKDNMKGCVVKCPQQNNFSDCGIFVLQYIESFFKTPMQDFSIPMGPMEDWFPDSAVMTKREELRLLILDLQQELNPELDYDPTEDGCVGITPGTMVTVPLDSGCQDQVPSPMISSVSSLPQAEAEGKFPASMPSGTENTSTIAQSSQQGSRTGTPTAQMESMINSEGLLTHEAAQEDIDSQTQMDNSLPQIASCESLQGKSNNFEPYTPVNMGTDELISNDTPAESDSNMDSKLEVTAESQTMPSTTPGLDTGCVPSPNVSSPNPQTPGCQPSPAQSSSLSNHVSEQESQECPLNNVDNITNETTDNSHNDGCNNVSDNATGDGQTSDAKSPLNLTNCVPMEVDSTPNNQDTS